MPYMYKGQPVDELVVSGGEAQDYGLSPWADWVYIMDGKDGKAVLPPSVYDDATGQWDYANEVFPPSPSEGDEYAIPCMAEAGRTRSSTCSAVGNGCCTHPPSHGS